MLPKEATQSQVFGRTIVTAPGENGCVNLLGVRIKGRVEERDSIPINGKHVPIRRAIYIAAQGEVPKDKRVVHVCSNSKCVNPFHAIVMTESEAAKFNPRKDKEKYLAETYNVDRFGYPLQNKGQTDDATASKDKQYAAGVEAIKAVAEELREVNASAAKIKKDITTGGSMPKEQKKAEEAPAPHAPAIPVTSVISITWDPDKEEFIASAGPLTARGATRGAAVDALEFWAAKVSQLSKNAEIIVQWDNEKKLFVADAEGIIQAEGPTRGAAVTALEERLAEIGG